MQYLEQVRSAASDAAQLEQLYRAAVQDGKSNEFTAAIQVCHGESPGNMLYAAWYHRLQGPAPRLRSTAETLPSTSRGVHWTLAIVFGLLGGMAVWLLTGARFLTVSDRAPWVVYALAPIEAALTIGYLVLAAQRNRVRGLLATLGLTGLLLYVIWLTRGPVSDINSMSGQYAILMALHLPLAAWSAVGLTLLGFKRDDAGRFAFLSKSIEVFVTAGIFAAGVGVFAGITLGLFSAINVRVADGIMRLLTAGAGGTVPVLAVAAVYDPRLGPLEQRFEQGLGKLLSTLMRLLLPLTVVVLAVYVVFIPLNFMAPFHQRDVLIIYNAMLFAIMGLLLGAIPACPAATTARQQSLLRLGVLVLAILSVVVSVYALSATVYRTWQGMLTPNRLAVIGWNTIHIGVLVLLIYYQVKNGARRWIESACAAFSVAAAAYIVWTAFLILAVPWLFR